MDSETLPPILNSFIHEEVNKCESYPKFFKRLIFSYVDKIAV